MQHRIHSFRLLHRNLHQRSWHTIVREFFPKGVTITSDPNYLAMVASEINDRPRKIHNWKKPSELFTELVEAHASTG